MEEESRAGMEGSERRGMGAVDVRERAVELRTEDAETGREMGGERG